jgi:outer membrane biosynthesis protein TonB
MKLPSGKRFGQSEHEMALAVFFSFLLHVAVLFVALFLHFSVFPKTVIPPAYQVKLVGPPKELVSAPAAAPPEKRLAPAPAAPIPKKEAMPAAAKPSPMQKKAAVELKKPAPKKNALPDPGHLKQKPAPLEQTKAKETAPRESPAAPSPSADISPAAGKKSEGVAVTSQQDFKYSWYLDNVREKIRQNWNPPPDMKDAKATVVFKVNRSGWVVAVQLDNAHSNGSFQFKAAAMRAIQTSNPFPPLPEEFYKQSLEFSVDLVPEK